MAQVFDPTVDDTMASTPDVFGEQTVEPLPTVNGLADLYGPDRDRLTVEPEEPVAEELVPAAPLLPAPPIVIRRPVQGRYEGTAFGFSVELRVNVDGSRTTRRVSGDFFSTSGSTIGYFGSFVVDSPAITVTPAEVRVRGMGSFTWSAGAPIVEVTVPRVPLQAAQKPATLRFFTVSGSAGATYTCSYSSPWLRTVAWEQDSVAGAVPFVSYNTALLPRPPGVPTRASACHRRSPTPGSSCSPRDR
ncbi:MAG: hypothetical protein M3186_11860 [Actinomycetota bacterium]|nr:hypothetical protein [Actinomycetota bacterium]